MEQTDRKIIVNQIKTPDGTVLISHNRHDYVTYTDKNGQHYSVDGGEAYLRRGFDKQDYEEISLYDDSPFEEIRKALHRGGRGKDGKQPLTYTLLAEMNDNWVQAVIDYEEELRPNNVFLQFFRKELEYRKENSISIKE